MRQGSRQRDIVLQILKGSFSHPTAEEIFRQARTIDNNISLGTIYRNLDILCRENTITKIATNTGVDRYDYKKTEHHHAICQECGNVIDFASNININNLTKDLVKQTQFNVCQNEIRIIGVCKTCQKKTIGEQK